MLARQISTWDGQGTSSLPFPTYHSQGGFLSTPWHRPYQYSDESMLGAMFLRVVWLHQHLGAFNAPGLKQQECYHIEQRPTQLARSGYVQEEHNNSFHECSFQLDQHLYHTFTHPHKRRNLPPVLYTFEEHYQWKTWRVTLQNVTLYTTRDKLPFQLQIISRANNSESMPHENPRFRVSKISGHV